MFKDYYYWPLSKSCNLKPTKQRRLTSTLQRRNFLSKKWSLIHMKQFLLHHVLISDPSIKMSQISNKLSSIQNLPPWKKSQISKRILHISLTKSSTELIKTITVKTFSSILKDPINHQLSLKKIIILKKIIQKTQILLKEILHLVLKKQRNMKMLLKFSKLFNKIINLSKICIESFTKM